MVGRKILNRFWFDEWNALLDYTHLNLEFRSRNSDGFMLPFPLRQPAICVKYCIVDWFYGKLK